MNAECLLKNQIPPYPFPPRKTKGTVGAVMEMLSLVKSGYYDVVTVKKDEITYQIKTNADNVLKFQRKKNEKEDMTL